MPYLFSHTQTITEYLYAITYWWNSGFLRYDVVSLNSILINFLNNFGKCVTTQFKSENMREEDIMTLDRSSEI
jgi:hypothetical protein